MKIDFLYTWTKNKDKQDEYMKSMGGNIRLPRILQFLFTLPWKRKKKKRK